MKTSPLDDQIKRKSKYKINLNEKKTSLAAHRTLPIQSNQQSNCQFCVHMDFYKILFCFIQMI